MLWVSRHSPLEAQIRMLEERLENIVVYQLIGVIPNAEFVIEKARELKAKYIVIFANSITNSPFLDSSASLAIIDRGRTGTISTYADGYIRVFEFEKYEKLIKIELITEPF